MQRLTKSIWLVFYLAMFFAFGVVSKAQELKVLEFRADMSMTDAVRFPKNDLNGDRCGLIKLGLVMPMSDVSFEGDIISVENKEGECWIYMPKGSNWLTIKSKSNFFLPLRSEFEPIQGNVTYLMTVAEISSVGGKPKPTHQYLVFQISPTNAILEVNGQLWDVGSDGSSTKFIDFGTYTYRVQAPNYHAETGKVTVSDPNNTQKVIVTLKPDFVKVTLKVDADAEIWVNNEKKGIRNWTGDLGKETYKIECKQAGHETSMITKEITADMNGQIIDLPKPIPVYGSLSIESTPSFAAIYIDGKETGETPKFIPEILVGEHTVNLKLKGYKDYLGAVLIKKGEKTQVQTVMNAVETPENVNSIGQANNSEWKVSWGWNIFDCYFGQDVFEMETGIRVRIGEDIFDEEKKLINFLIGADLHYFICSYPSDEYDFDMYGSMTKLAIPASVRLYLGKRDTRCYLGLGAILYPNFAMSDINPCLAIEPQLGISAYGLMDFGIHLRYMPNEYGLTRKNEIKYMMGWYWAFYFP